MKKHYSAIAVDLDEVVVITAHNVINHYSQRYGVNVRLEDYYSHDHVNVWGVDDVEIATARINSYMRTPEYSNPKPIPEALPVIKKLKDKYKLYIVTGRPDFLEKATHKWLDKHFPGVFDDIVFSNFYQPEKARHKGEICLELGADLLIDDHLGHILNASASGVDGLLFGDYPWGKTKDKLPPNVRRVKDWRAVAGLLL